MNKIIQILIGLILILAPVYVLIINWIGIGGAILTLIKGGITLLILLIGILLVIIGINDLRE